MFDGLCCCFVCLQSLFVVFLNRFLASISPNPAPTQQICAGKWKKIIFLIFRLEFSENADSKKRLQPEPIQQQLSERHFGHIQDPRHQPSLSEQMNLSASFNTDEKKCLSQPYNLKTQEAALVVPSLDLGQDSHSTSGFAPTQPPAGPVRNGITFWSQQEALKTGFVGLPPVKRPKISSSKRRRSKVFDQTMSFWETLNESATNTGVMVGKIHLFNVRFNINSSLVGGVGAFASFLQMHDRTLTLTT